MKITNTGLAKWQSKLLNESIEIAEKFICDKYKLDKSMLDLVSLRCSNTCRSAVYYHGYGEIRLDLKTIDVRLYKKKTLGEYQTHIRSVGSKISWTCQLIHELTHFIQDLEGYCYSEVETTKNELEYLNSIGIN